MRPHLLYKLSCPFRQRQLQRTAYKRIPAAPQEGETDGVAPLLAPELRWVLDTQGPQPLKCLKSGKTRVSEPYRTVEHIRDMNFSALPSFITSSRDERLLSRARQHNCSFAASTSSMTSAMSHIYYALSEHMPLDISDLSGDFEDLSSKFTYRTRKAISIILRRRDKIWGLDSYPNGIQSRNRVLMDLGKALECKLTMEPQAYIKRVMTKGQTQPSLPEAYAYTKMGRMMVRSQLDCRDSENNWFDLKTRAVLSVRHNVDTYEKHLEYLLDSLRGEFNSYEREWYDMARSVLLKYSFQARLGRMTGVFVAYHNTSQIFGLEYVPLAVMDKILFRTTKFAEFAFDSCVKLLERLFAEVTNDMGEESTSIAFTMVAPAERKGTVVVFAERVLSDEPIAKTDQLSKEELVKRISEASSEITVEELSQMDWGSLATRYDEVCNNASKTFLTYSEDLDMLRQLYEKAEGGHLMLYEINISCKGTGAVSSSPGALPSDYELKYSLRRVTDGEASPRALAREIWCLRRPETIGEMPVEQPPKNFMYPQCERNNDMELRRRLGPRGKRRKEAGVFNFLGSRAQRKKR